MGVQTSRKNITERVPPRRRRRKHSVAKRIIMPTLRLVFIGVGVLLVINLIIGIARPFRLNSAEGSEKQHIATELASLKRENADLQRRIDYLKTPKGTAQAARKLGYVKPGEITLVIPEERQVPNSSSNKPIQN